MEGLILIGSKAVQYHFSDFRKTGSDIDLASKKVQLTKDNLEIKPIPALFNYTQGKIASPDILYTLKVSHSFWNIHWAKTMWDIAFLQSKGCNVIEPLFQELYQYWSDTHKPKSVRLNVKNEEFFKPTVDRIYPHDEIHKAIAYGSQPMYEKCKEDLSLAKLSKSLFDELPFEDKLKLCREEIYVIALERYLIPCDFRMSKKAVYLSGARKVVTSLSKGWFPRFIVENWSILKEPDDHNYIKIFKEKFNLN